VNAGYSQHKVESLSDKPLIVNESKKQQNII